MLRLQALLLLSHRGKLRVPVEGALWEYARMTSFAKNCRATVIPGLRYRDCPAAIEWLCRAFGFEQKAVYPNPDGTIAHAELRFGNGMIMLGSVRPDAPGVLPFAQPEEIGLRETQVPYLTVSDCTAIYQTAKNAGALMVRDLAEMDYGGKAFTCRDPEGHLWSLGEYDPWEHPSPA
ncbi:MAG TPA: VOC family protein [Solirubrobacteraceae bacterium]|nr:VOC family protein [Solirubrobacteraceae bacterium]